MARPPIGDRAMTPAERQRRRRARLRDSEHVTKSKDTKTFRDSEHVTKLKARIRELEDEVTRLGAQPERSQTAFSNTEHEARIFELEQENRGLRAEIDRARAGKSRRDMPPPRSESLASLAVPGRLNTKSVAVLPVMSTGSSPV